MQVVKISLTWLDGLEFNESALLYEGLNGVWGLLFVARERAQPRTCVTTAFLVRCTQLSTFQQLEWSLPVWVCLGLLSLILRLQELHLTSEDIQRGTCALQPLTLCV